jgi:hypothetical protein
MVKRHTKYSLISLFFHISFWASAFVWLVFAGEAGSPLPDNWQELLFYCHVAEAIALASLIISVVAGLMVYRTGGGVPYVRIVSLLILIPTAPMIIDLLQTEVF